MGIADHAVLFLETPTGVEYKKDPQRTEELKKQKQYIPSDTYKKEEFDF